MVTLITDKLKNQSLEDLPGNESEVSAIRPRVTPVRTGHFSDCSPAHRHRRETRQIFGHSRTRSYPSHRPRRSYCRNYTRMNSSTMHSSTQPPANKKLCPSLSVPSDESAYGDSAWIPRPSSVWQPVEIVTEKPRSVSCPDEKFKLAESLWVSSHDVDSISTPPASPTPRPASADAALEQKRLRVKTDGLSSLPLGNKAENTRDMNFNWSANFFGLHRSRSQPCFDRKSGVKRRIEDDFDVRRPALDLAKMEETSYFRCQDRKKGLRIPRYMNKRCSRGSATFFTEPENFTLKPIASSPLDAQDSSIMITPISSPTKQLDCENFEPEDSESRGKVFDAENAENGLNQKPQDEGVFHLDYDSDLDLNSIEEDDLF